MQTVYTSNPRSLHRNGARTHPSRLSLDDAARIAATWRRGGRALRCPHCGRGLTMTTGTAPEQTVVVLTCEACGSSLVLEAHRTASIPTRTSTAKCCAPRT